MCASVGLTAVALVIFVTSNDGQVAPALEVKLQNGSAPAQCVDSAQASKQPDVTPSLKRQGSTIGCDLTKKLKQINMMQAPRRSPALVNCLRRPMVLKPTAMARGNQAAHSSCSADALDHTGEKKAMIKRESE